MKEWTVDGKTRCIQTISVAFRYLFSRKNRKFTQSLRFARLLGEVMIARGFSPASHHARRFLAGPKSRDKETRTLEFDDLVVLKTAAMPAVLLECGVIINRTEEASLQKPEIQQRIADAATEAIIKFVRAHAATGEEEARKAPPN